jgi:hypothetical protein
LLRAACPSLGGEVTTCVKSARPVCVPFMKFSRLFSPSALARLALAAIKIAVKIFFNKNS